MRKGRCLMRAGRVTAAGSGRAPAGQATSCERAMDGRRTGHGRQGYVVKKAGGRRTCGGTASTSDRVAGQRERGRRGGQGQLLDDRSSRPGDVPQKHGRGPTYQGGSPEGAPAPDDELTEADNGQTCGCTISTTHSAGFPWQANPSTHLQVTMASQSWMKRQCEHL